MDGDARRLAIEAFERVERRMFAALSRQPVRGMLEDDERLAVRGLCERSLGLSLIPEPEIAVKGVEERDLGGCRVVCLSGWSWPGVVVTAHLYLPDSPPPWPAVLVCCGHGRHGKSSYAKMGLRLARQGAAALISDNIGQGEREPMGHRDVVAPFALGFSLQGLIVRESMAWLKWLRKDGSFTTLGAAGNSGGGTLTMFLAALSEELSVVVSSGYPGSFELVARKQKKHCHCNLIPGCLGSFDMWELYSLFAPRPLMLLQGMHDNLFLADSFLATGRKVSDVYRGFGAGDKFSYSLVGGGHSWDESRRGLIGSFFAEYLGLRDPERRDEECRVDLASPDTFPCLDIFPDDVLDTEELACSFSGASVDPELDLWDVFPTPGLERPVAAVSERGDSAQILAQWECFMRGASLS